MLGSLRARLIISFTLVVGLAVFLAGAGALFLLRDQQQTSARERYGRFADPVNLQVNTLLQRGDSLAEVKDLLQANAHQLKVRIVLIDTDLQVVYDSEQRLAGQYILSFEGRDLEVVEEAGLRYTWTNYDGAEEHLTLFAAPPSTGGPEPTFAPLGYEALIAIPASELASAWLDLAPRLALAGAIALSVSFIVSYFISRSISGPLARITQASVEMSRGNYDVHISVGGQDEVGRLSEAFNAMAREVNESQRVMKELLANVSHELKTPLTSIQGFSQAILDGAINSDDEYRESSRIINEEANRMRGLVDDLLLISQIQSGQVAMQHAHVDLAELLRRTAERFHWALRDAGIDLGMAVDHVSNVHGDERRLEQVFSNLIENAVRHTPRGGVITITAAAQRDGRISVGIRNTGSFIPAEDLPRVFERFFQVDRARARKGGSSGLGLAIVAEIVDAHGGDVRAVSEAETGTEFIVTLPSATAPLRGAQRTAPAADPQPKHAAKNKEVTA